MYVVFNTPVNLFLLRTWLNVLYDRKQHEILHNILGLWCVLRVYISAILYEEVDWSGLLAQHKKRWRQSRAFPKHMSYILIGSRSLIVAKYGSIWYGWVRFNVYLKYPFPQSFYLVSVQSYDSWKANKTHATKKTCRTFICGRRYTFSRCCTCFLHILFPFWINLITRKTHYKAGARIVFSTFPIICDGPRQCRWRSVMVPVLRNTFQSKKLHN